MAEPTSKFQPETLDFIARNARKADLVAKILDLPANALIGAVANEFDTRHNPDLTLTTSGAAGQWLGDRLSQRNAPNPLEIDHRDLEEGYNTTKKVKNLEPGWWEKFTPDWLSKSWDKIHEKATNPAAVDVGPGNIRIETAIDLLKAYTAQHPDEGDDPLALKKYVGRYDLLRDDLLDFNNPDTSLAFSGLMVERAEPFFVGQNKDSWNRLSPDERDALRIMYYKMGPGTLSKNIAKRRAEAQKNGQQYNLNPYGDGGEQHLNNLPGIDNALHLGRVQGERAIPHVPESVLEKEPYFYGSGAGLPTSVYRKDVTGTNPQYSGRRKAPAGPASATAANRRTEERAAGRSDRIGFKRIAKRIAILGQGCSRPRIAAGCSCALDRMNCRFGGPSVLAEPAASFPS
ncbi:hypothetical protein BMJ31_27590 [Sinorhizobium medicae]|nr:hypothetical protein BMJ31_27590 [Sinorhizobium medicae]